MIRPLIAVPARFSATTSALRYAAEVNAHLVHPVAIRRGTLLEQATGAQKVEASCHHHQRVNDIAPGLTITARAADGTVEGLELVGGDGWFTAVHWHPEDTAHEDPAQQGLFDALVRAAARNETRNRN
nr:gamma-glutamyl-gamma-aminobutyrate hydrolase family protein [Streptomyces adelaidensis]